MLKQPYNPKRKTTDVTINGECWQPIVTWLSAAMTTDHSPNTLFIEDEALPGIQQLLRRTRKLTSRDDVNLRLAHRDMEALADQVRFWEGCMDELNPASRQSAPNTGWFQEMAIQIEEALQESFRPPSPELKLFCHVCRQPMEGNGTASIDITPEGLSIMVRHPECPIPQQGAPQHAA